MPTVSATPTQRTCVGLHSNEPFNTKSSVPTETGCHSQCASWLMESYLCVQVLRQQLTGAVLGGNAADKNVLVASSQAVA